MAEKQNVYQIVTDQVIAALDQGIIPWKKPWRSASFQMPISGTGHLYRGINVFLLAFTAQAKGYTSPVWLTFKKANELDGKIKTGEKSTLVVFWSILKKPNTDPNTMAKKPIINVPMLKFYRVFNSEQTENVKLPKKLAALVEAAAVENKGTIFDNAKAQAIVDGYEDKPQINHGAGAQAAYSPALDVINIARQQDFDTEEGYWNTLFHEFTHSTGHVDRLNRKGVAEATHFGDAQYADEELVAEMGAAFLSAIAGVDANGSTIKNHAAYIASWKKRLTDDPKLVVSAAARAQKAADYIQGTKFEQEDN
jgi:antirestriction protein ArdC